MSHFFVLQSCSESEFPVKPPTSVVVIDSDEDSVPEDDSNASHVTISSATTVAMDVPPVYTVQIVTSDDSTSVVKIEPPSKPDLEPMQSSVLEKNSSPSVLSHGDISQDDTPSQEGSGASVTSEIHEHETYHLQPLSSIDVTTYKLLNEPSSGSPAPSVSSFVIDVHGATGCDSMEEGEIHDEDEDCYFVVDSYSDDEGTIGQEDSTSLPQDRGDTFEVVDSVDQQTTSSVKKKAPVNPTLGGVQKKSAFLREKKRLANIRRRVRRAAAKKMKLMNEQAKNSFGNENKQEGKQKQNPPWQKKNIGEKKSRLRPRRSNRGRFRGPQTVSEHDRKSSNGYYLNSSSGYPPDMTSHRGCGDVPSTFQHPNEQSVYPLMSSVPQKLGSFVTSTQEYLTTRPQTSEQSGQPINLMSIQFPQEPDVERMATVISTPDDLTARSLVNERSGIPYVAQNSGTMSLLPAQSGVPQSLMNVKFEEDTEKNLSHDDIGGRTRWFGEKVKEGKPLVIRQDEQATVEIPGRGDLETINYQIEKHSVPSEASANLTTLPFQIETHPGRGKEVACLTQNQYQTNEHSVRQIDDQNFTTRQFRAINTSVSPLEASTSQLLKKDSPVSQQHQTMTNIGLLTPKKVVPKQKRKRKRLRRPAHLSKNGIVNSNIRKAALNEAAKRQPPKREGTNFNYRGQITSVPSTSVLETGTLRRHTVSSAVLQLAANLHTQSQFHGVNHPQATLVHTPSQFQAGHHQQTSILHTPSQFHSQITSVQSQFHAASIQQPPTAVPIVTQQSPAWPHIPTALSTVGRGSVKTSSPQVSTRLGGVLSSQPPDPSFSGTNTPHQTRPAQQDKPVRARRRRKRKLRAQPYGNRQDNVAASHQQQAQFTQNASQLVNQFQHAIRGYQRHPAAGGDPSRQLFPTGVSHPPRTGRVEPNTSRLLADIDQGMSTFVAASRQIVESLNSLKRLVNK